MKCPECRALVFDPRVEDLQSRISELELRVGKPCGPTSRGEEYCACGCSAYSGCGKDSCECLHVMPQGFVRVVKPVEKP